MTIKTGAIIVPLVALLAASSTARAQAPVPAICPAHDRAGADTLQPRVVRITMYNRSRLTPADIDDLLAVTNRIWTPYGVTIQLGAGHEAGAVTVVLANRTAAKPVENGPVVLGSTLFTEGHATPYINLSLAAAEGFAENTPDGGVPFTARPLDQRDAILVRMLGVAFAHEMAHYLLDTAEHSSAGLLQAGLTLRELASPEPARLQLTLRQQRLLRCDDRR